MELPGVDPIGPGPANLLKQAGHLPITDSMFPCRQPTAHWRLRARLLSVGVCLLALVSCLLALGSCLLAQHRVTTK
jgi:hypothetical protein